ncbi:MAG: type II toxin-antitoxin system RelE/ParE family toxin [Verrucomicrobia bacterium]|nr:type II toxin-antitoxin system RelE/ParE family toxin [Verrucomicrobiota bacterium]
MNTPQQYQVELKPKAVKDLKSLTKADQAKVAIRLQAMENNLEGDVKKLTNHTPEFRMRVGNYRALFEIEGKKIVIYRILHRKEVYR